MTPEQLKAAFVLIACPIVVIGALLAYYLQGWFSRRSRIRELERMLPSKPSGRYSSSRKREATEEELEIIGEIARLKSMPVFSKPPPIREHAPATDRQLDYIEILGGHPDPTMTMIEASNLIQELKERKGMA